MTHTTTVQGRGVRRSTYFFGALGGLLFGYDLGIVAGALLFINPDFGLSKFQTGEVTRKTSLPSRTLPSRTCGASAAGRDWRNRRSLLTSPLYEHSSQLHSPEKRPQ